MQDLSAAIRDVSLQGWAIVSMDPLEDLLTLARHLGVPIPSRVDGPLVQTLSPIRKEAAPPKSLSALHGTDAFPWHTDAAYLRRPPRYLILQLATDLGPVSPSLVLPFQHIPLGQEDISEIRRSVWLVRAGLGNRRFLASVIAPSFLETTPTIRYDSGCMVPADDSFLRAQDLLESALSLAKPVTVQWEENRVLIVDNWRCLHSRPRIPLGEQTRRSVNRVLVA